MLCPGLRFSPKIRFVLESGLSGVTLITGLSPESLLNLKLGCRHLGLSA